MTFDKFILELENNNKSLFSAEKIKISSESFKKQLKIAYDAGYQESDKFHKDLKNITKKGENYDSMNVFKDIFGGGLGKK